MVAINTSIAAALRLGQTIFVGYVDIILIIVFALLCAVLIGVLLSQRSGNKLVQRLAQLGEVTGQLSHSQAELSGKSQRHMGQADEDLRQIRISTDKMTRRGERINEVEMGENIDTSGIENTTKPRLVDDG